VRAFLEEKSALVAQLAERRFRKDDINIINFVSWLQSQNKRHWTVKYTKNYAIKYGHILDTGDASALTALSPCNRQHAMAALASLSKYQGRYSRWLDIRKAYNLKWSSGNSSIQALERFFNPDLTLDSMIDKVKQMMQVLPKPMAEITRFSCLVGLRPAESCESVRLINLSADKYYNQEQQCLTHYLFPDIFLRNTKKCFLSYLSFSNYQRIASLGPRTPTWNAIRLTCRRRKVPCNFRLTRKIFASHLIKSGIDSNTVDMLSGRCPANVLVRHYQSPDSTLRQKILDAIDKLQKELQQDF